jgi:hypothetical protein
MTNAHPHRGRCMNIPHVVLSVCLLLCAASHTMASATSSTPVAATGATRLGAVLSDHRVVINIWTHKVDIGKMGVERPDVSHNNCTYSRIPCSVVEAFQITVDGSAIFVPRSAFCDLSDVATMEVEAINGHFMLAVFGGDASEAYEVKLEFDTERTTRRVMASGMDANHPLEITTYYEVSLAD